MPLLKLVRVSPDLKRTNDLLERIAIALERLSPEIPALPEEKVEPLVIDDAESEPKERDESAGLREPGDSGEEDEDVEEP